MSARDVAVVGDGPAGSALASALHRRGVDVVLIGDDRPWSATYTSWVDDVEGVDLVDDRIWLHRFDSVAVRFERPLRIERRYGVLDNERLRARLQEGVSRRIARVAHPAEADARLVIDATGWPSGLDPSDAAAIGRRSSSVMWQTAFGVVLAEAPPGPLGSPTMMDFADAPASAGLDLPTFVYSFPVADGWLVEETVLVGTSIDADRLLPRLASRLGLSTDELWRRSIRVERVRIPMGVEPPSRKASSDIVRFGAAAGMIHPATGYSVAASLRAADRVAAAIAENLEAAVEHVDLARAVSDAVWPTDLRRARRLHAYGLDVLLGMDGDQIRHFFQTFFELPEHRWAAYLRIDTPTRELVTAMASMFGKADWPLRRRLAGGSPRLLAAALRP